MKKRLGGGDHDQINLVSSRFKNFNTFFSLQNFSGPLIHRGFPRGKSDFLERGVVFSQNMSWNQCFRTYSFGNAARHDPVLKRDDHDYACSTLLAPRTRLSTTCEADELNTFSQSALSSRRSGKHTG